MKIFLKVVTTFGKEVACAIGIHGTAAIFEHGWAVRPLLALGLAIAFISGLRPILGAVRARRQRNI